MAKLEIKLDDQIPDRDIENVLLPLYNNAWGWFDYVDFDERESRFSSPNRVIAVYDDMQEGEEFNQGDLRFPLNLKEYTGGKIPVAAINGMPFLTYGNYSNIPERFCDLFHQGELNADTMLFYSLIALPSRRGRNAKGEVNFLMKSILEHFGSRVDHIYTYTPDKEKIWQTHVKRGARDTGEVKPLSRISTDGSHQDLVSTRIMAYK